MQKIGEKTAEIDRSGMHPKPIGRAWERFDIYSTVETHQRRYPDAEFTYNGSDDHEIQVRNAELFKNALDEAITNAIEHTGQSQPEVTIAVHRDLDADQFRISVIDTGPGIPEPRTAGNQVRKGDRPRSQSWDRVMGDGVDNHNTRWRINDC